MQRTKAGLALIFLIAAAVIFSALMKDVIEAKDSPFADAPEENPDH